VDSKDLGALLRGEKISTPQRVIKGLQELAEVVKYLRLFGFKISSTTGVWDLFHIGHGRYLEQMRAQGHISIVEVDSDEVVRMRKPDDLHRPIVPLDERIEMLSFVRPVDLIYPLMAGEDPIEFIRVMRPDAFIVSETSADSKEEYLSQVRDHCGEVVVLPAQAAISTTRRIQYMMMAGGIERLVEVRDSITRMIGAAHGDGDIKNPKHDEVARSSVVSELTLGNQEKEGKR
jgi:cytidyltransferase-like protein